MAPCRGPERHVVETTLRRAACAPVHRGARRSGSISFPLAFLVGFFAYGAAGCGPAENTCSCVPCDAALVVDVRDAQTGDSVSSFVIEARRDEELVSVPVGCGSDEPDGLCRVGADAGRYHLVVIAPGYAPREQVVRVASRSASDTCCMGCVAPVPVRVSLEPQPVDPAE